MKLKHIVAAAALWAVAGVAGAVGHLAHVTVYDRVQQRTLPVYRHEGRLYVVGTPGHEYEVRVRNRTDADMLAVVSVDGVNAVSGETAHWDQTGYLLGAHQSHGIRGWRKSMERTAAFFFTEHANAYATRTGRAANVGVIGVAVFRSRAAREAQIAPRREPAAAEAYGDSAYSSGDAASGAATRESAGAGPRDAAPPSAERRSRSLGTGHGRSETSHVTYANFERATAHPEEVIAIHYDTRANLVATGVIRAPRLAAPVPFPGAFVPDPR